MAQTRTAGTPREKPRCEWPLKVGTTAYGKPSFAKVRGSDRWLFSSFCAQRHYAVRSNVGQSSILMAWELQS